MYDVAVIGGGPAAVTAAIYAVRKNLSVLLVTKDIGGQMALSADIENWPGTIKATGVELTQKFQEHLDNFEIDTKTDLVGEIVKTDDGFKIKSRANEYNSKTVIIATGRKPRELGIPGEKECKKQGVTYCATCDAPLFAGKDVVVVGGGNSGLDAVLQLISIANKIYLVEATDKLIADEVMVEKAKASEKVEIFTSAKPKKICGDGKFVTSFTIEHEGQDKELSVGGVFIEIGYVATEKPDVEGLERNEWKEIVVNEKCETNIPGLFAAGDVTNVPEKQIVVAAGQGCIASIQAFKYLSTTK